MLEWLRYHLRRTSIYERLTIATAIVGIAVAATVADIYKRQLDTMRESLTSVQRAFVYFDSFDIARVMNNDMLAGVSISVRWKNSGTTPAIEAIRHVNNAHVLNGSLKDFNYQDLDENGNFTTDEKGLPTFYAPQAFQLSGRMFIKVDDLLRVKEKQEHIYLYGWAKYRDVFKGTKRHVSMFCYEVTEVDAVLDLKQPVTNIVGAQCPDHNCADEQCIGQPHGEP